MPSKTDSRLVTQEELAGMFEAAFSEWNSAPADADNRRQTPRVSVKPARDVMVMSFVDGDEETILNKQATISDISADGLGIRLPKKLPLGALVRVAFAGTDSEQTTGVVRVARCRKSGKNYRIGLEFFEDSQSLDVSLREDRSDSHPKWPRNWPEVGSFGWCRMIAAYRVLTKRGMGHAVVESNGGKHKACFIVDAKLFRYNASLYVDNVKVCSTSGSLQDRCRNLFADSPTPTVVCLSDSGYSAQATVLSNEVTDCRVDSMRKPRRATCT